MQKFIKFVSSTGEKEEVIVDINIILVHIRETSIWYVCKIWETFIDSLLRYHGSQFEKHGLEKIASKFCVLFRHM